MNITYEECGDYLILDPEPEGELRKYGLMKKSYLENHHRGYSGMLFIGQTKGASAHDIGTGRGKI